MSKSQDIARYGIDELAERGGVTRRTVRYYVRRGLLPAPTGTGRGKHYTEAHLRALIHIRQLQEAGVSLAEIQRRISSGIPQPQPRRERQPEAGDQGGAQDPAPSTPPAPGPALPAPEPTRFTRVSLGPGLELNIAGHRSISESTLARLRDAARAILSSDDNTSGSNPNG